MADAASPALDPAAVPGPVDLTVADNPTPGPATAPPDVLFDPAIARPATRMVFTIVTAPPELWDAHLGPGNLAPGALYCLRLNKVTDDGAGNTRCEFDLVLLPLQTRLTIEALAAQGGTPQLAEGKLE